MLTAFPLTMAGNLVAFIDGVGGPEMLLIFVIVLMLFGGDKLPEFARGLGKTMRELKKAATGVEEEFKRAMEDDERKRNAGALDTTASTPALTPGTDYDSGYNPEDGSTDYSAEAEAGPAAPVADAAAAPTPGVPTDPTAANPATDQPASKTPAVSAVAVPPPPPPVVPEDYP